MIIKNGIFCIIICFICILRINIVIVVYFNDNSNIFMKLSMILKYVYKKFYGKKNLCEIKRLMFKENIF